MVGARKDQSVGAIMAQAHYDDGYKAGEAAGRDSLIREMFEALAEWEKHGVGCYCSACEVLRPAFDEWQRLAAVTASVSRETDAAEQPKRRRGRSAA